jgi:hypothetical protein
MDGLRSLLGSLAQIMMVVVLAAGVLGGFFAGGAAAGPFGGFHFGLALLGALVGFCISGISMSFLAILLDIRQTLLRLDAKRIGSLS